MNNVGSNGNYWSSTASDSDDAYYVFFYSYAPFPSYNGSRFFGSSVRLITDVK